MSEARGGPADVRTLVDVFHLAANRSTKSFLSYVDDLERPPIESVTHGEFLQQAQRVAANLRRHGIRAGDRVALVAQPRVEYAVTLAGSILAGAVAAPVNHHFKTRELAAYLSVLDPAVIVVDDHTAQGVKTSLGQLSSRPRIAGISGYSGSDLPLFAELGDSGSTTGEPATVTAEDPAIILHSSGTTGLPKAVVRTHGAVTEFLNWFGDYFDDDERILSFLPLYHQAGLLMNLLTASRLGLEMVQQSRYSTSAFWDLVDRYGATHMNLMAPVSSFLLGQPPHKDDRSHTLRWTVIAGRNDHWAAFQERFGVTGMTFYGSTETLQITTTGSPKNGPYPGEDLRSVGHGMIVGRPIGDLTEFRLVDEAGGPVNGPGTEGLIEVRGLFTFSEYLHQPERTEKAFTTDGWFITGDLGYTTDDGELVLLGRAGGMIRRSGENIPPREIELVLEDHPDIAEALVKGVPDEDRGQEILACIVLRPGAALTAQRVFDYLEEHLSSFKVPRYLVFQDHFEHTATFKIKLDQTAETADRSEWHDRLSS